MSIKEMPLVEAIEKARAASVAHPDVPSVSRTLLAELDRLRARVAELEELEVLAGRYRFLRGDACPDWSKRWMDWEVRFWDSPRWTGDVRRRELDAAIDAAMKRDAENRMPPK